MPPLPRLPRAHPPPPAVYNDASGVEGQHSCILFIATAVNFDTANAACNAMGTGVHLVTTQVGGHPVTGPCATVCVWMRMRVFKCMCGCKCVLISGRRALASG